jgi:hypothetical protein
MLTGKDIFESLMVACDEGCSDVCLAHNAGDYSNVIIDGINQTINFDDLAERLNARMAAS